MGSDADSTKDPYHHFQSLTRWDDVRAWRKAQRVRLVALRENRSIKERGADRASIIRLLRQHGPDMAGKPVGFYWPMKGEVDLRPFIRKLLSCGIVPALPVIIGANQALEFWLWEPRKKLCSRGLWSIPAPAERNLVYPFFLFVPLLGFDDSGYRLGHGGGYYDLTLASLRPQPLTIGVGYEFGRLPTIFPQAHDIPMDGIVTESGLTMYSAGKVESNKKKPT